MWLYENSHGCASALFSNNAFLFVWHCYGNATFGYDELLPTSNGSIQNFNGWGVMLHDSLNSMLLMRLKNSEEYKHAMEHVAKQTFKDHAGCCLSVDCRATWYLEKANEASLTMAMTQPGSADGGWVVECILEIGTRSA
ncbi:uncharacterized protein EI90DRAFT_3016719 [Cantharellus anzutake]|uniref:uncharacterized protein n=1 Tax=Cantharellus anzutake TaxID=1750568 RepID=UPI001908817F|nr:uncharacterized protein EI90DRAFT_3016719 [Cantharellus anzutake]KAF8330925.1 hypothetical protein EI90DRAFT_3016719 [Cantharellus anzutake]